MNVGGRGVTVHGPQHVDRSIAAWLICYCDCLTCIGEDLNVRTNERTSFTTDSRNNNGRLSVEAPVHQCWCLQRRKSTIGPCRPCIKHKKMTGRENLLASDTNTEQITTEKNTIRGRALPLYSSCSEVRGKSRCLTSSFERLPCREWIKMKREIINKKLSYRKETVRLLHNIEIRVLH